MQNSKSNWKKAARKNLKNFVFNLKIYFYRKEKKISFEIGYILIDLNWIFPMKPLEITVSILLESYDEKTTGKYRNCYVAEKRIASKL